MEASAILVANKSIRLNREQLKLVPAPTRTNTWTPVQHFDFVDALTSELNSRKIDIKREEFAVQNHGTMIFGVMDLELKSEPDYGFAIGFRASNNKRVALQIAVGTRVFVCDNLCFSGQLIALNKKHSGNLQLDSEIRRAMDRYQEKASLFKGDIEKQKNRTITDEEAKIIIYEVFKEKYFPIRHFLPVSESYFEPAFESFKPRTMWSLNNAFTEAAKELKPGPKFLALTKVGSYLKKIME